MFNIDDKDFREFGKYLVLKGDVNDIQKEFFELTIKIPCKRQYLRGHRCLYPLFPGII